MTSRVGRGKPRIICVMMACATVAGCARDTPYAAPGFPFLASYASRQSSAPILLDNVAWWTTFRDPVLDALIKRALVGNPSLDLAKERIREAQANLAAVPGAAVLSTDAALTREGEINGTQTTRSDATLGLSWMLDPYGARRDQIKVARARIEVADAETDAAQLLLLLNVSNSYVDLRYSQRLLQIRQQELRARQQTLDLVQKMFDQRSATRLDLISVEARLAETETALPGIKSTIQSQKFQLAVLLGMTPGTLDIPLDTGQQPRVGLSPEVGIPADLLRNRPDIKIAERLYYASVAEVGVADADLYPKLSLGGAITLTSIGGTSRMDYYFGPTLRLPAFPGTSRRAVVAARQSQARQAHIAWKSTVLDAILEVETALLEYSGATGSVRSAQKAVRLYREAVDLTRDLVLQQGATVRDLLDADKLVSDAELTLAENQRLLNRSFIRLNVSLGSGTIHAPAVAAPAGLTPGQ